MNAIAFELSQSDYDIIALQAVWVRADYEMIRSRAAHKYPYAKFFDKSVYPYPAYSFRSDITTSGVLGAGLAFLSHYPIVDANMHPYSVAGRPFEHESKDFVFGKGAASVIIRHPVLDEIEMFTTHVSYSSRSLESFRLLRF